LKKPLFVISGLLFGIISVLHLLRLFYRFEVLVGGWVFPHWVSYFAFPLFGLLSFLNWRAARQA
jgi:hypothetical protein